MAGPHLPALRQEGQDQAPLTPTPQEVTALKGPLPESLMVLRGRCRVNSLA